MQRRPGPLMRWLAARQLAPMDDLPPGVLRRADLAYGPDPAQRLDLYLPEAGATGPVLVVVHGGGWRRGDKAAAPVVEHKLRHWVARGWALVSVDYRMPPDATPRGQADDVARALAWVQREAEGWGADPRQVVLFGHSAGAHLAALVAVDRALAAAHGAVPWPATVLADSAALDVEALMRGRHLPLHDEAFGADPSAWAAMSPWHQLQAAPTGALLLVSSARRADSTDAAEAFAARVRELGGDAECLAVDLGHLALNGELGRDPDYTAAVDDFLRRAGVGGGENPAGLGVGAF